MSSSITIPTSLLDLLQPYLSPPAPSEAYPPITLFIHPHPTISRLLSTFLPRLLNPTDPSSSSSSSPSPPRSPSAALIDAIEFGSSVKSFAEELYRQWALPAAKWDGWEGFLRMLEREETTQEPKDAVFTSSEDSTNHHQTGCLRPGRILVIDRAEQLRGPMGFGPGGLAGLFCRLNEMVRPAWIHFIYKCFFFLSGMESRL